MEIKVGDIFYNDYLTVEVVSLPIKGCNYVIKLLKTTHPALVVGKNYYMHYSELCGMYKCIPSMDIE